MSANIARFRSCQPAVGEFHRNLVVADEVRGCDRSLSDRSPENREHQIHRITRLYDDLVADRGLVPRLRLQESYRLKDQLLDSN